jgi:predicted GNAT family acetyltransferase
MSTEIHDNPLASRWEARVDGVLAGAAAYQRSDGVVTFTHTVVEEAFEGQGVGGALARTVLDDAREQGLTVVPRCPFIAGWIEHHPDYADLVSAHGN